MIRINNLIYKKSLLLGLVLVLFAVTAVLSQVHNHAANEDHSNCPSYLIQILLNAEVPAVLLIIALLALLYLLKIFEDKTVKSVQFIKFSSRAPPLF